jgi:hypothetical protein
MMLDISPGPMWSWTADIRPDRSEQVRRSLTGQDIEHCRSQ